MALKTSNKNRKKAEIAVQVEERPANTGDYWGWIVGFLVLVLVIAL